MLAMNFELPYKFEFQVILLEVYIIFIYSLSEIKKKELIVWQEE